MDTSLYAIAFCFQLKVPTNISSNFQPNLSTLIYFSSQTHHSHNIRQLSYIQDGVKCNYRQNLAFLSIHIIFKVTPIVVNSRQAIPSNVGLFDPCVCLVTCSTLISVIVSSVCHSLAGNSSFGSKSRFTLFLCLYV